ncbi:MAG: BON domain-containing protein [Gammaproteobacteria bacterium]|nr:BON domain-containing protein [Gammaproteobacteria bacterium]
MSVEEDLNRAARKVGKQRNMVLVALLAVIALGMYLGSAGIEEDLQARSAAALNDAALPVERINVGVEGRTARLTGFADSQREADDAVAAIAAVDGIGTIENFLQVRQSPLLTGPAGEPPNAAAELMATAPEAGQQESNPAEADPVPVTTAPIVSSVSHLRAEWDNGRLTLTGVLGSAAEHRLVQSAVAGPYRDATVVDQVAVQPGLPPADWLGGFAAHLPSLRARGSASMESSAAGLHPVEPGQPVYVVAADAEPAVEATASAPEPVAEVVVEPAPGVEAAPAVAESQAPVAASQNWLHLRSQMGRVAISGTLGSERERQALASALRIVYPPSVTWNSVRIGDQPEQTGWLDAMNSLWALLQPIELLDIEISARGVNISGWTPSEDQSRRIMVTLTEKFAPLPVDSALRSIQSQTESYAAADQFNHGYANAIGFARDGVSLSWAGHVTLAQIAKRLRRQPAVRLQIGVHTDGRGDAEANRLLTEKRAESIAAKLLELGVGADQIKAVGFGSSRPLADNLSPVGRALNRRVVFSPL